MAGKYEIPHALVRAVKASPKSQAEIAREAGTSPQQFGRLLSGERKFTKEWAARIAPVLDTRPIDLLFDRSLRVVPQGQEFEPDPEFDPDASTAVSSAEPYKPTLSGASPEMDVKPGAGLGTVGQTFGIESKGVVTGHRVVAEWVISTCGCSSAASKT